jgi:hypothetical protein
MKPVEIRKDWGLLFLVVELTADESASAPKTSSVVVVVVVVVVDVIRVVVVVVAVIIWVDVGVVNDRVVVVVVVVVGFLNLLPDEDELGLSWDFSYVQLEYSFI